MVLDNASIDPSPGDNYNEPFPSSDHPVDDGQTFDSSSSDPDRVPIAPGLFVDLSTLPRPVFISPLARRDTSVLEESIKQQVKVIQSATHRPARQEEVDALAFHTAKGIRLASYGAPIGTVLAVGVAARGHSTYRFPFYSPMKEGGRFSPDWFPLLKGLRARVMWQTTRYSLYALLGSAMASVFFGSYGLTVSLQGRVSDPRMKDFMDAMRKAQRDGKSIRDLMGQGESAPGPRPRDNETFEMARQRAVVQDAWKQKQLQTPAPQQRVVDDASPTGGMFSDEFMDAPAEAQDRPRSTPSKSGGAPSRGDAWERLRQGAVSAKQDSAASSNGQDEKVGNTGFSSSPSETSLQLANSDDQKQFDARVQREREGRDLEDRSAGQWK